VRDAMAQLKAEGTQANFLDRMTDRKELYRLIHYEAYEGLDQSLATQFSSTRQPQA